MSRIDLAIVEYNTSSVAQYSTSQQNEFRLKNRIKRTHNIIPDYLFILNKFITHTYKKPIFIQLRYSC